MLNIVDNKIYLVKGDKGELPVKVTDSDGNEYTMGADEYLSISVRTLPDIDLPLLLYAESNPGSNIIIFPAAASAEMEPGIYSADIQFNDGSGEPYTIWPNNTEVKPDKKKSFKNFYLTPEVTK